MSEANVELVRWAYEEGHARRTVDMPGADERIASDYRFHARRGWPGRAAYRREEMTSLWADLDATFTDYSLAPESYEAIGDEYVLARLRQSARLRGSDHRIDDTVYHLWRLSGGKIEATWTFADEGEARGAADQGRAEQL